LNKDEHGRRMQQHPEAVGDALHHGRGVRQAMQRVGDIDENAGAAMFFAGKPVQAQGFECGAELSRQDSDFGDRIVVKAGARRALQEGNGAEHFSRNQQRRGQSGVRVTGGQPGIPTGVEAINKKGSTLLNRLHDDGCIAGSPSDATKGLGIGIAAFSVGFGSDEFAVRRATPIVGAAGLEERARQDAKSPDELAGIAALKSGPGKLQEKLLERLVRLRRIAGLRISGVNCQRAPIVSLSG